MPWASAAGADWPGLPHGDLGPWWGDHRAWSDGEMFVAAAMGLDLSYPAAAARLANLARGGSLSRVSEGAYGDGLAGLVWVGPVGAVPCVSQLVQVHVRDVVTRGEGAVLALRWQAAGPGGRLFPALDADMSLTPAGERSARLSLAGVYRLPLDARGAGLDRASFTRWPTRRPGPCWPAWRMFSAYPRRRPAPGREPAGPGPPGSGRTALARLSSGERIRLLVIEHDVPDIPDRQLQLADGCPDLPGSRMAADQPRAVSRASPAANSRRTTRSFMSPAIRSRSRTRSTVASAQSPALPGGGSRVGRMLASSSSGIARSRRLRLMISTSLGT